MKPIPKDRQRKKLRISEEEFFENALFLLGPPKSTVVRNYIHNSGIFDQGPRAWIFHSVEGRRFLTLVEAHGEAKVRAVKLWYNWERWFRKQQKEAS